MSDGDGLDEVIEQHVQVVSFALARHLEVRARRRERQLREAEEARRRGAERIYRRLMTERDAARSIHMATRSQRWWDRATADDVAHAWRASTEWSRVDAEAARSAESIREEVRERWGVDPDAVDLADAEAVRRARRERDQREQEREDTEEREPQEREEREQERQETAETVEEAVETAAEAAAAQESVQQQEPQWSRKLRGEASWQPEFDDVEKAAAAEFKDEAGRSGATTEQAEELWQRVGPQERADRLRTAAGDLRNAAKGMAEWDTVERRQAFAASMSGVVSPVVIEARLRADMAQGRPPTDAVRPDIRETRAKVNRGQQRTMSRENQRAR